MKKVDVLFTGLIRKNEVFKKSIKDLTLMRKKGVVDKIILSTWDYEVENNPEMVKFLEKNKVLVIGSKEPKYFSFGTIGQQMKAMETGLKKISSNKFVLKTRTDIYINPNFLRMLFKEKEELLKIINHLPNGNIFKYKIWIPWFEITKPFYISDECFFGYHQDMEKLINYDLMYDKKYNLGKGISHIRRFIHPFLEKYPILFKSLEEYKEEEIIQRGWNHGTLGKLLKLYRFKIFKKIGLKIRFQVLKKKLKKQAYLDCLAAYYSILYGHFYVDSASFPNQITFMDYSKPSKLDSYNLEANFSIEKIKKDMSGQIYCYDNELISNLFNKKIKKTEISIRLMKTIDRFNNLR